MGLRKEFLEALYGVPNAPLSCQTLTAHLQFFAHDAAMSKPIKHNHLKVPRLSVHTTKKFDQHKYSVRWRLYYFYCD